MNVLEKERLLDNLKIYSLGLQRSIGKVKHPATRVELALVVSNLSDVIREVILKE